MANRRHQSLALLNSEAEEYAPAPPMRRWQCDEEVNSLTVVAGKLPCAVWSIEVLRPMRMSKVRRIWINMTSRQSQWLRLWNGVESAKQTVKVPSRFRGE